MKHCFLFPGQGAQHPGMGKDLFDASPTVRRIFEAASDTTGLDLENLLFSGTEEQLTQTDVTQVAITLVNLAAAAVLSERGITPAGCAGFSLGEYAALASAGVLTIDEVLPIVKIRGALSARVASELAGTGDPPGMSAVIGLSPEQVTETIERSQIDSVYPANLNSPSQTVIAGLTSALDAIEQSLKNAGARRVIRLKVTGAFHTPLMQSIVDEFRETLEEVEFRDPRIAVYSNVTGSRIQSGEEARSLCLRQLTNPVRWTDEEQAIERDGYEHVLEVGPGTVLCGLWKAAPVAAVCRPAGTIAAMDDLLNT